MRINKNTWLGIALTNLSIVAFLGLILRSKILFSIPFLDFKNMLHAHSHFAFGGWITLALMALMAYEILPKKYNTKKCYQWLLGGILLNAFGMLFSFPFQGYAFFSIVFSTLFIFVSYAFTIVFTRHLSHSGASKTVKMLSVAALIYLALSSVGPFTLAYLLAHRSGNAILYRDSIYTYLHLQYNGFFTLGIFALFVNRIENILPAKSVKRVHQFAWALIFSVLPSMFLSFLWHYPNSLYRLIAAVGSSSMIACLILFFIAALPLTARLKDIRPLARNTGLLAFGAFVCKMALQPLTLVPSIGALVFMNRPVIIGFLHMVLLGFVTLYLVAHLLNAGYLRPNNTTRFAVYLFSSAVTCNTLVLMAQGLDMILGRNSATFPQLLWLMAILMLTGSVMLLIARRSSKKNIYHNILKSTKHSLIK